MLLQGWAKSGPQVARISSSTEVEVVGNSRNKIYKSWGPLLSPPLYMLIISVSFVFAHLLLELLNPFVIPLLRQNEALESLPKLVVHSLDFAELWR